MSAVVDTVRRGYNRAGLGLLPVKADGTKRPDVDAWLSFKTHRPTVAQMRAWDFEHRDGVGVLGGAVSGYLDPWDFDDADTFEAFVVEANASGLGAVLARIRAGYEAVTPSGGRRLLVRYPSDQPFYDVELARRPEPGNQDKPVKILIEITTFSILPPSQGGTHPTGKPYVQWSGDVETIASYTADERRALFDLARSFDAMPRSTAPRTVPYAAPVDRDRPGDDFNTRTTWRDVLVGWTFVYDRGATGYWRRPGKPFGVSASTNIHDSDLLWVFSSSTPFESNRSYDKFGAYAVLEFGGDLSAAASALAARGYGRRFEADVPSRATVAADVAPCTLADTLAVFRRWLALDDPAAVYAVAATLAANRAVGDPVWLLIVCAPSSGKTEILSAAMGLPFVVVAAKVTEAALLSGTPKRERVTGATGGLLRQIGSFGVLLVKDFTSVLAMNRDARAEALAALREVYDGTWARPVGTDGGRVLDWRGKCGLVGAVTPAYDSYTSVIASLGDRFVLLRLPEAPVKAFGAAALRHGDQEAAMRADLQAAFAGLVVHADLTRINRPFTDAEQTRLIRLATYTARARTGVMRDGYRQDVSYLPQVEGPGRLVKAYARLLGGLEAIGCDAGLAWGTLTRVAIDTVPAIRTRVVRLLLAQATSVKTATIAEGLDVTPKTVLRYLEDLTLLKMATSDRAGAADNAAYLWTASDWLREFWPGDTSIPPADANTSVPPGDAIGSGHDGTEMYGREYGAASADSTVSALVPVHVQVYGTVKGQDDSPSSDVPTLSPTFQSDQAPVPTIARVPEGQAVPAWVTEPDPPFEATDVEAPFAVSDVEAGQYGKDDQGPRLRQLTKPAQFHDCNARVDDDDDS